VSLPRPSPALSRLPPYLFVRLNAIRAKAEAKGLDVIDLGMGNPDRPTPAFVVEALRRSALKDTWSHRYPTTKGLPAFRQAVAGFYRRRFGVRLDPETEVLPLIGSKEGLAHLCSVYLPPRGAALVPSPCYPVHINGPALFGSPPVLMPLREEYGFLPEFGSLSRRDLDRARFMILNYPNNPTAATVDGLDFFEEAVRFARRRGLFIVSDLAYSELCFDGYRAPSLLEVPGSKAVAVEFHSLSKTYNMAGWRVAFAVGNQEVLAQLGKLKTHMDYGIPGFIQQAGVAALEGPEDSVRALARMYQRRRDVLAGSLQEAGWTVPRPRATMYLWGRVPRGGSSVAFAERLLLEEGVVLAPGAGFGPQGEGWVRFALVGEEARLKDAARRIGRFLS